MEHQMESSPSARSTIQRSLQQIKEQFDVELRQSISTLTTTILRSGLKYESLKETSTDKALTFINAQLLVISLCESLNKEMLKQDLNGVNLLGNEKQLENLTSCLKEIQTSQIQKLTKTMA